MLRGATFFLVFHACIEPYFEMCEKASVTPLDKHKNL